MRNLFHSRSGKSRLAPNDQISATLGSLIAVVLGAVIFMIPYRSSQIESHSWMWTSGLVIYVFVEIWNLFWLFRLERRRFAAIGEERWLAHTQPVALPFEVPRPSVIIWRIKWTYITPWLLIMGWWLAFANWQVFALVVIVALALFLYSFPRPKIEIAENGLTEREKGTSKKTVNWSEAQFFACYRIPILFLGKNIVHYEVSSQTTRVSWMWVSNTRSPFTAWTTEPPPDEYQQQMQALCALVREKTGLPLYDLTQKEQGEKGV
jgi:hypothetical protein